jgi:hypothetical protein
MSTPKIFVDFRKRSSGVRAAFYSAAARRLIAN